MTDTGPVVDCLHVSRAFGHGPAAVQAVRDVTCQVRSGDHIAIIGPSGSGKSTLLHLFAGLDQPSTGTLTWPMFGPNPRLRPGPIAMIFQASSLLDPLDVLENVALPLLLQGVPDEEANTRARDALERLGLAELIGRLPEELSGGQAQRVAVARALVARPALILADEPTGQLDAGTAAAVTDALVDTAQNSGAALVVATHDPAVAERLTQHWSIVDGTLEPRPANVAS